MVLTKQTSEKIIPRFQKNIFDLLLHLSDIKMRNLQKTSIENIVKNLKLLLRKIMDFDKAAQICEQFLLDICLFYYLIFG